MAHVRSRPPRDDDVAPSHARWGRRAAGYLTVTAKPLHTLAFCLPLIVAYEVGSAMTLGPASGGVVENIRAHSIMLAVFQDLGVVGRFVPAALLITVLIAWHVINGDRLRLRPPYLAAMALESLVWTIPLLVLMALVQLAAQPGAPPPPAAAATLATLSPGARVTISIGAGLYEELLFRMIGMAVLHALLVDAFRLERTWGTLLAVLGAAIAFAVYHDVAGPQGEILWGKAIALVVLGVYFGLVYALRGFGLAVGVHALYDVFVLVILPR